MIRKSTRSRELPPELTSAEREKLVEDANLGRARGAGGAGIVETYVLARTMDVFLSWIRASGGVRKLQDCKYLGTVEDMKDVGFTSPLVEMVQIEEWSNGREREFVEEAYRLCSRYCLEKRVHGVPVVIL